MAVVQLEEYKLTRKNEIERLKQENAECEHIFNVLTGEVKEAAKKAERLAQLALMAQETKAKNLKRIAELQK